MLQALPSSPASFKLFLVGVHLDIMIKIMMILIVILVDIHLDIMIMVTMIMMIIILYHHFTKDQSRLSSISDAFEVGF